MVKTLCSESKVRFSSCLLPCVYHLLFCVGLVGLDWDSIPKLKFGDDVYRFDGNIVDMSSWGNETVFVNDLLAEELVDAKI